MQASYYLIGDKIRDVFNAETIAINNYDEASDMVGTPYLWSQGRHLPNEAPIPLSDTPLRKFLIDSRKPWIISTDSSNLPTSLNAKPNEHLGRWPKSGIGTPIIASDKVIGIIQIMNMEQENAFFNADLHLLETIANSMSVALAMTYSPQLPAKRPRQNGLIHLLGSVTRSLTPALIHNHLICLDSPIAQQIHIPHLDSFGQIIQPETSGVRAGASGGDFAALRQ